LLASFLSLSAAVLVAAPAGGHIQLISPKPRYADLKEGPCGRGALDDRTTNVTTFKAGETIAVTWKETIGHPSHYRISFDPNGASAFADPESFTDVDGGPAVLVDGIADKSGTQTYSQDVTLPDVACDRCTLQLIQVMTDKPPYGDGNDLYYQCADVVLTKDSPNDEDAGTADGSSGVAPADEDGKGGCALGGTSPQLPAATLLGLGAPAALLVRRRSRARKVQCLL
jgi:hypothetical protein